MNTRAIDMENYEEEYLKEAVYYQPWLDRNEEILAEQEVIKSVLEKKAGAKIGSNCFIAPSAKIFTSQFSLGNNSWIAAGAIVRGNVSIGDNSTVNPNAHIAGYVKIGSGVRIAGMVSIYGFNHGFNRIDRPIWQQATTYDGVVIGDNTWIGANAVVLDGCTIGQECIIAAGSVVTRSFPEFSIIGGNPAKIIRDRRDPDLSAN